MLTLKRGVHRDVRRALSGHNDSRARRAKFLGLVIRVQKNMEPMDPVVWERHLPEEVIHTILAWLPIRSFCRLRSVCKSWNEAVKNASFRRICSRTPSLAPFWIVFACEGPLVFDSTSSTWHVGSCFLSYRSVTREAVLEASGSLMFYRNLDPHDRQMFVFNPVSKHKWRIPAITNMNHCYVMGMVLDKATHRYKIFAVDEVFREQPGGRDILRLQLYDPTSERWEMSGSLQRTQEDPREPCFHEVLGAAFCNGLLYCLTETLQGEFVDDPEKSYHLYKVEPVAWEEVKAQMPIDLSFPCLFENRGRLLLGGGLAVWIGLLSVHLWQLDEATLEWVEILRMPEELVKELAVTGHPYVFVTNGDYIGVGCGRQKRILRYMCDLTKGDWSSLPSEYDQIPIHRLEGATSSGTLLFEPRLDALFDAPSSHHASCSSSSSYYSCSALPSY